MSDLLAKGAKKTEKKTKAKSTTPVVALPDSDEMKQAMKDWRAAKQDEKTAQALRKQQEEILRPAGVEAYENHCRKEGKHHDSVKVQAGTEPPITLVHQNRYSEISLEDGEKLKQIFGELFEKCFQKHTEVKLSDKAMLDIDAILEKIVGAVGGEEKFFELFDITQTFKPTEIFHKTRLVDVALGKLHKTARDAGLLKLSTPFFRA
jgi:hypothetical protein